MFSKGFFTIARLRGAPIRVHWSALLAPIVFTGFSLQPGAWVGIILVIILHEIGHALLVRRFGYKVIAMRVYAFGGDCQMSGGPTAAEHAVIAWGGVLAQAALWIGTMIVLATTGQPSSPFLAAMAVTFTTSNAWLILFNLMPIPPLDGFWAWQLIPMWLRARRELRQYIQVREALKHEQSRQRRAADLRHERARAIEEQVRALEQAEQEPPEMPAEVEEMLARVVEEVSREEVAKRKQRAK